MKKVILFLIIMYFCTSSQAQYPLVQWAKKLQSTAAGVTPASSITGAVLDNSANIYVVGSFTDTLFPDPSSTSIKLIASANDRDAVFFAKYNPSGALIWARAVGTGFGFDIALDRSGCIYITGYGNATDSADFDPGPGKIIHTSGTDFMFMCKYDNNGNYLKSRFFNGVGVKGLGITTDSLFNIYVSGCVRNPVDFDPGPGVNSLTRHNTTVNRDGFYAKYDSSINLIWARLDIQTRDCEDIAVHDASGRLLVASQALRLVNLNGITTDSLITGIAGTNAVRFDDAGNMYYSGFFRGSNVNFNWNGNNTLSTTGPNDEFGFLVKYNSAKVFQWAQKYKKTSDVWCNKVSTLNSNILLAYYEADGVLPHRGFFKVNPATGLIAGPVSDFATNTGYHPVATALYSAIDNSIVFTGNAGLHSNAESVDIDPDTAATAEQFLTGNKTWAFIAKYSNCTAPPAQPGTITGNTNLCSTGMQIYSVVPVAGATRYNWLLPSGWSGSSDSAKIIVQSSTTGGVISVTVENFCGVSPAGTLNVIYAAAPTVSISASSLTVCAGEQATLSGIGATSYNWSNSISDGVAFTPSSTNTYYVTGTTGACSDTASVTILVKEPTGSSQNQSICSGQSYLFNGSTLTNAGVYYDTLTNTAGCDSVITLTLTVLQNDNTSISAAICTGETYLFNGTPLTASGIYYDTVTNTAGCYAITTLTLAVNQPTGSSINASVCPGEGYPFDGYTLTVAGVYYDTLVNAAGCDSIITLTLTFRQPTSSVLSAAICPGQSYLFNGINRTTAGVYRDTLVNSVGCDSIITLTLSLKQNSSSAFSIVICPSETYFFNGAERSATGVYRDTLVNSAGCDSIITLNLTVLPNEFTTLQASICAGAVYPFGAQQLTTAGIYTDTLTAFNGCDSIITLTLTVSSVISSTVNASICAGETYVFNGQVLGTSGNYSDTLQAAGGCDSIVTLNLTVDSLPDATITAQGSTLFCQGDSVLLLAPAGNNYLWNTAEATQRIAAKETGSYSVTVTDTHNCTAASNIITITANELPAVPEVTRSGDTLTSTSADSYQWYLDSSLIAGATNQQYVVMQNGNYLVEVTDNNGCSSRSALFNAIDVNVEDISEELGVKLYPNPNNGEFVVEFAGDKEHELEITDAVGRIFFSAVIADKRKQMNINHMAPGSYLLNVKQYGQTRCFKLSLVK